MMLETSKRRLTFLSLIFLVKLIIDRFISGAGLYTRVIYPRNLFYEFDGSRFLLFCHGTSGMFGIAPGYFYMLFQF